jgi:hypothetical protein
MSRFLKTYEEWNPFLSKEEKDKRAEEAKKKEEEEFAKRLLSQIGEIDEIIQSYKNSNLVSIEKSKNTNEDFIYYKLELKDNILDVLNLKIDTYEYSIILSNYCQKYNYIVFQAELNINKNNIDISDDIIEKINSHLRINNSNVSIYSHNDRYQFKIRIKNDIKDDATNTSNINEFLDGILNKYSRESLNSYLNYINGILLNIEKEKEKNKKREKFKEKANEILDCFYDVIDLCDSHDVKYFENENMYVFLFNIRSIKINTFDMEYKIPYGRSFGETKRLTVDRASFYLDDKMLDFFYYLSEAKPRINDLVPNCEFKVEMKNGQLLLAIK